MFTLIRSIDPWIAFLAVNILCSLCAWVVRRTYRPWLLRAERLERERDLLIYAKRLPIAHPGWYRLLGYPLLALLCLGSSIAVMWAHAETIHGDLVFVPVGIIILFILAPTHRVSTFFTEYYH